MPSIDGVDDETIRAILTSVRTIAVISASPNPARPSNDALGFLIAKGFETIGHPAHSGGLIHSRARGLTVVMNRCAKIEFGCLFGRGP